MNSSNTRRNFIRASAAGGAAMLFSACSESGNAQVVGTDPKKEPRKTGEKEVPANEDLMREHGVLRRALLVYTAAAERIRKNAASVPPDALQKTAKLFRTFGEDYHEKKLEEPFIFPVVKRVGGAAASYPDILVVQHDRGREITDYILSVSQGAKLNAASVGPLANTLDSFVLMYEHHAAREDTIVFPAWKKALSNQEYYELGEKFEQIEHQQFGGDGFDEAVKTISEVEGMLGLTNIAQFTPPPPPKI